MLELRDRQFEIQKRCPMAMSAKINISQPLNVYLFPCDTVSIHNRLPISNPIMVKQQNLRFIAVYNSLVFHMVFSSYGFGQYLRLGSSLILFPVLLAGHQFEAASLEEVKK